MPLLSLASCATAASDACPPVVAYARAEEQQAAADLALLPPGSPLLRMLEDYAVLRAQSRLCRGK